MGSIWRLGDDGTQEAGDSNDSGRKLGLTLSTIYYGFSVFVCAWEQMACPIVVKWCEWVLFNAVMQLQEYNCSF